MQRLLKLTLIVLLFVIFIKPSHVYADEVYFDWVKKDIYVPYGADINDYQNDYVLFMYVNGNQSNDFIVRKEVNYTSFRTVTTNHIGTYRVAYQAYSKTYNIQETKDIFFHVIDEEPPLIVGPDLLELEYENKIDILNNFTITDNETSSEKLNISLKDSNVTYTILGTYQASIIVIDSSGNKQEKPLQIKIIDTQKPSIKVLKELKFSYGVTPEIASYFSIYDNYDGYNLTSTISLENKIGKSTVSITSVDSSGNEITLSFDCEVIDDEAPELELSSYSKTLEPSRVKYLTDKYWLSYISSCVDNYSTNISYYVDSNITDEVGDYYVYIYAIDEFGNEAYQKIEVYVRESKGPVINYTGPTNLKLGQEINIDDYISVYDEYTKETITKYEILDEIDFAKSGVQTIRIRAYNTSGKYTIKEIEIKVTSDIETFLTFENILVICSSIVSALIIIIAVIIKKRKTKNQDSDLSVI